jgi:drug/metabolite transporter (DMT)-like permease
VSAPPPRLARRRAIADPRREAAPGGSRLLAPAALATAGALWGTSFPLGKLALGEMGVGHMVLYRFVFACLALLPFVARAPERVPRREVGAWIVCATLGVPVQFMVQYEGLRRTTVSHASLMVGTLPVLLAICAVLVGGERMDRGRWLCVLASAAGAALIVFGAPARAGSPRGPSLGGDLLVVASLLATTAWVLISKRLSAGHSPLVVTGYVLALGTATLAAWVLATQGLPPVALSWRAWASVAWQGVLGTAGAALLWNWGLNRVPASRAGVFVNFEPLVGTAIGVTLLHDRLGVPGVVGGLLIIAAALGQTGGGEHDEPARQPEEGRRAVA